MDRTAYIVRRLLLMIPTFIGITLLCFSLTRFLPGGPVEMRLMRQRGLAAQGGGESAGSSSSATGISEEYRKELTAQFGFDKPIWRQYWDWLVVKRMGMMLPSYDYPDKTAWELIRSRIPISIWFGLASFVLTYMVCIPLGIAKALRHRQAFDAMSSLVVFIGYAIPVFALAMTLKMLFCGTVDGFFDIFPLGGISSDFDVNPTLLDQIASDYVRTVIAKGATRSRAIWAHAFRNALVPIATGFGSLIGVLFAGSIIIETVFDIPGMGRLSWDALIGRDYAVFLSLLSLTAVFQLVGNLISDTLYMLIDPRIDFSGR